MSAPSIQTNARSPVVSTELKNYFGITTAQFTTGLNEELTSYFTPNPTFKSFVVADMKHVLWFAQPATALRQFITQMVTDDAAWASVQP